MHQLSALFNPASVAVIGVSRKPHKLGRIVFDQLISGGFAGKVIGINPNFYHLDGHPVYPSISEAKEPIDLAILAIPRDAVKDALIDCGYAGVKAAIIFSSGFRETNAAGLELEEQLVVIAQRYGIRLLGPNCLGFLRPSIKLNATFLDLPLKPGNIGMISQSGALGSAILDWAQQEQLGFSFFASLGNKGDLNELHFLEAALADKETSVISMYLESLSDGQAFLHQLQLTTPKKPVIVLKPGASAAAQAAIVSHTGHLAGNDAALDAALRQAGALRAHTMEEFFLLTKSLSRPPQVTGKHITIVTNAGGPAVLATDALEGTGLQLTTLSQRTKNELIKVLPAAASTHNPVDVLGDAPASRYEAVLEQLIDTPTDAVIAILTPQATSEVELTAQVLANWAKDSKKVVVAAFLGGLRVEAAREYLITQGIPVFDFPETAVKVLALALHLHNKKETSLVATMAPLSKVTIATLRLELGKQAKQKFIQSPYSDKIFAALGLTPAAGNIATSLQSAVELARKFGWPVVLKRINQTDWHKTEGGAIKVNLRSASELQHAYKQLITEPGQIFVEKMITDGVEVFIGAKKDPDFGSLIAFGLGGIYTEVYGDVAFGVPPLSKRDAILMIERTKTAQVLHGVRGHHAKNIDAVANALVGVAKLMSACPEISELDLNPVIVTDNQAILADAKIRLAN